MTITTVSSREFDQDASGARRAASKGPVIIKDRGRPSHVLLTIDAYQNLTQKTGTIADLLAMPGVADIAFETPRTGNMARPADLGQLMFVLDTNVVSELRKAKAGKADRHMAAWASGVPAEVLFVSAITILELETGVLLVHRRDPRQGAMLRTWLDQYVLPAFQGRVLSVDTAVAQRCAALHVPDPRSEPDALIAATTMVHNMTEITRNAADFAATGVALLNPWDPAVHLRGRKVRRPRS